MQYEGEEALTLNGSDIIPAVNRKKHLQRKERIKKYIFNKVLPVIAHVISLLIGLGIIIIMSQFME